MNDHHVWDIERSLQIQAGMVWRPLGRVSVNSSERLALPKANRRPAIYCFRIRLGNGERRYVGETENLSRRFSHYVNPGPSQQTNIRLKQLMLEALHAGSEISVSVVQDQAWIVWEGGQKEIDLNSKAARCLLENVAILEMDAIEVESLNRASGNK